MCLSRTLASGDCLWCLQHKEIVTLCSWVYHPITRAIIIPFKKKPERAKAYALTTGLSAKIDRYTINCETLLPIPSHWKRKFLRPIQPTNELAYSLSKSLNCKVDVSSLKKIKNTPKQFGTKKEKRLTQQKNSFRCKKLTTQHIAIVDDVITTGGTINAAIKAIKQSNPECEITILSVARADLQGF